MSELMLYDFKPMGLNEALSQDFWDLKAMNMIFVLCKTTFVSIEL